MAFARSIATSSYLFLFLSFSCLRGNLTELPVFDLQVLHALLSIPDPLSSHVEVLTIRPSPLFSPATLQRQNKTLL